MYTRKAARNTGSPKALSAMTNRKPVRDRRGAWGGGEVRSTGKPGNAGGGKGPQFKTTQYVVRDLEIGNLSTPINVRKLQMAVARESVRSCREPDAGICLSGSMSGMWKRSHGGTTKATARRKGRATDMFY